VKAEKCPYHDIPPEYRIDVFREEMEKSYVDASGNRKTMVFPRLADHYWFCPACHEELKADGRRRYQQEKLGVGYYSQDSSEKALANWNKAVAKLIPELIRRAAEGKR